MPSVDLHHSLMIDNWTQPDQEASVASFCALLIWKAWLLLSLPGTPMEGSVLRLHAYSWYLHELPGRMWLFTVFNDFQLLSLSEWDAVEINQLVFTKCCQAGKCHTRVYRLISVPIIKALWTFWHSETGRWRPNRDSLFVNKEKEGLREEQIKVQRCCWVWAFCFCLLCLSCFGIEMIVSSAVTTWFQCFPFFFSKIILCLYHLLRNSPKLAGNPDVWVLTYHKEVQDLIPV